MSHTITDKRTGRTILDLGAGFSIRTYPLDDGSVCTVAVGQRHPAVVCADAATARVMVEGWRG